MQALTRPALKVPFGQAEHTLAPPTANQPFGQAVQFPVPAPEMVPFAHVKQAVAPFELAGNEKLPAGQAEHVLFLPSIVENVPTAHGSQSRSVVLEQAVHPG